MGSRRATKDPFQRAMHWKRTPRSTYEGQLSSEYSSFLNRIQRQPEIRKDRLRTNGVSFGPQIRASQVKKSSSDMGPGVSLQLTPSSFVYRGPGVPAVNIPSGDPIVRSYSQLSKLRKPDLKHIPG